MPQLSKKLVATTRAALLYLRPGKANVHRRFIAVGYQSNGFFVDELLLEVGLVAIRDGEIHDYRHWIRPREGWPTTVALDTGDSSRASIHTVSTTVENMPQNLDNALARMSIGEEERLTLVGNGVRTLVDHLIRASGDRSGHLTGCDLLDTTTLARGAGDTPSNSSSKELLTSLGLSDISPDSALADALDAATASRAILTVRGPNLEKLTSPYVSAQQAPGDSLVGERLRRHRCQQATATHTKAEIRSVRPLDTLVPVVRRRD
jgi:hypothetical protein